MQPSKAETPRTGLTVPVSSLSPMDWVVTDICEKKLKDGKKRHFLVVSDRARGFLAAYELRGTKTKIIVTALQSFVDTYVGPP